jgi:hypothetical protein
MSTLRTNALEGVDAKNSITIVAGAGNITTTNIEQGLAKVWIKTPADGASISDSFNVSSATDSATGQVIVNINNDMANADYAIGMSTITNVDQTLIVSDATGSYDMRTWNGSAYVDIGMRTIVAGDLA